MFLAFYVLKQENKNAEIGHIFTLFVEFRFLESLLLLANIRLTFGLLARQNILLTSSLIGPPYTIRATIFEKVFPPEKFPKTEYFPNKRTCFYFFTDYWLNYWHNL